MQHLTLIQIIAVNIVPLILAITLHEVAHGYVAFKKGDPTAKMLGRLTINPIKHISLIGTIIVPLALLAISSLAGGGFIFGWAKPVPIVPKNFKNPRRDMAIVAAAGPIANIVMAMGWALLLKVLIVFGAAQQNSLLALDLMSIAGIQINVFLAVLNLIPLPPLDGGRVLTGLLPTPLAHKFAQIEPYGFMILIILIATNILTIILLPMASLLIYIIASIFGLPFR